MDITSDVKQDSVSIKIKAQENGKVLGWVYLYVLKNGRHDEPFGLVENLYVNPETRGQGVGTKLVEAVITEAKRQGCYKLIGTSRNSRPELQKFYTRFGFEVWGVEYRMNLIESKINNAEACEIKS